MDEPLGALDKQLRESLQLEMRRLHADLGITFIYVTHDQEEALTMSDRIAVMNEGLIAQVGSPEDLYDRPCDRFVASFIGELNFLPGVVRGFEDGVGRCRVRRGAVVRGVAPNRSRNRRQGHADHAAGAHALRRRRRGRTPRSRTACGVTVTEAVFAGERCRYLCQCEGGTADRAEGAVQRGDPAPRSSANDRNRLVGRRHGGGVMSVMAAYSAPQSGEGWGGASRHSRSASRPPPLRGRAGVALLLALPQ